jgi:hypothetical protein
MKLRKLVEIASKAAERCFNRTGELLPMWHCLRSDGAHMLVPTPSPNKDTAVALMKVLFEIEPVVGYVFMDEAWIVASEDAGEARALAEQGRLSEHPDRVEIIMFTAEDETGMLMAQRKIIRPPGKKPRLGPLEIEDWKEMEGRFIGLLPTRERTLQ